MDVSYKDPGSAEGYLHGGNPSKDMSRLGLSPETVNDFSTSLNPIGHAARYHGTLA